jgi:hypothetical protein
VIELMARNESSRETWQQAFNKMEAAIRG